jgi:signal transduction histidine kinase
MRLNFCSSRDSDRFLGSLSIGCLRYLTDLTFSPLLDLSRIAGGTLTLSFEEVDLKALVHSSVETLQAQAARKGIALSSSVEIPGEVDRKVWGDKIGLQQILANL